MAVALPSRTFDRVPPGALPELMDRPDCDPVALLDALETIDRAGRWSGRDRLLRREVARLLRGRRPGRLALLDVGAGAGHGALRLARRLARAGWRPRVALADLHPQALRIARQRLRAARGPAEGGFPVDRVELVRLTGPALPFRDRSFDLAVSCTTLHHLELRQAGRLLAEMGRVARRGVAVVDLRRSRFVYAATRTLAATAWRRHPLPRLDGPTSVRRSFTAGEARVLLAEAGLADATVRATAFWIALGWERPAGAGAT